MTITENKVVSLTYDLRIGSEDGQLVEQTTEEKPLEFIYGIGNMLPKFEENIKGSKEGENFEFMLTSADAYGKVNEDAIIDLPIDNFKVNGVVDPEYIKVGKMLPMQDKQGRRFNGFVREVREDSVTIDFNHPLAGENLFFSGEVIGIRDATKEEIEHGHIHKDDNCEDGNCNGCDGNC